MRSPQTRMGTAGGQLTLGDARIRPRLFSAATLSKGHIRASCGVSTRSGFAAAGGSAVIALRRLEIVTNHF